MRTADPHDEAKSRDWFDWVIPGAISILVHLGLVASIFASAPSLLGAGDIIKAELLDIADSNSLRKKLDATGKEAATHEVSNEEMVQRLNLPLGLPRNLRCSVAVTVARDGEVLEVVVTRSTGDPKFDRSIVEAVFKSSPFPKPSADDLQAGVYRFELRIGEQ